MTTLATLQIILGIDSKGLSAGVTSADAHLSKLTTGVTRGLGSAVPLSAAAAGVAVGAFAATSFKAAMKFEEAFTRIDAISNVTTDQIGAMKDSVMELAGETAQAPAALADALFFLSSAGLSAQQAMDTLELSAKASAVGLGSTTDIAKITANALNAYADSGLTAAHVTDILVAAVREGSADPDAFAAALGRILPIAAQAGVEFDNVTASLAALSNIGLDVNEGVTAMRGLMTALVAPTAQSQQALAAMGLTSDDVRKSLEEDGLIGTLRMLEQATGGDIDKMKALVPNVRALTGVFGLTGQEAAKVDAIFRNVADSTGALGEAWRVTAESDAFKLKQALNDITIAGQELAIKALPGLTALLQLIADPGAYLSGAAAAEEYGRAMLTTLTVLQQESPKAFEMVREGADGASLELQLMAMAMDAAAKGIDPMKAIGPELAKLGIDAENAQILVDALGLTVEYAGTAFGGLARPLSTGSDAIAGVGQDLIKLGNKMTQAGESARNFAGMTSKDLKDLQTSVAGSVSSMIGNLDGFEKKWSLTSNAARNAMQDMATKSGQMARDFKKLDTEAVPEQFKAWLLQQGPDAVHAFVNANKAAKGDMVGAWKAIEANLKSTMATVKDILGTGGRDAGVAFASGLAQGIASGSSAAVNAAVALANRAVAAAKDALGVHSPSAVARAIGADFIAGLIEGLESKDDAIRKAAEATAKALTDRLNEKLEGVQEHLDKVLAKAQSFQGAIAGSFGGFLDVGGALTGGKEGLEVDPAQWFTDQLAAAQQWASVLQALKAQGASAALLQQLAAQGPGALGFAQSILQGGPDLIKQINEQIAGIEDLVKETSKGLTDEIFGKRIDELRDDLHDIRDHLQAIEAAVKEATKAIEARTDESVAGTAISSTSSGSISPAQPIGSGMSKEELVAALVAALEQRPLVVQPAIVASDVDRRVLATVARTGLRRGGL